MQQKQCAHCKEFKDADLSNFTTDKTTKSGFSSWCKVCVNARAVERRKAKVFPDFDPETLKCCTKCKETKKVTEYQRSKDSLDGFRPECRECTYQRHKEYASRPTVRARLKEQGLLRAMQVLYGLSAEEYKTLCETQTFCLICLTSFEGKKRNVDHNHVTGEVRGLLCDSCNLFIGLVKEDTNIISKMIKYLEKYK